MQDRVVRGVAVRLYAGHLGSIDGPRRQVEWAKKHLYTIITHNIRGAGRGHKVWKANRGPAPLKQRLTVLYGGERGRALTVEITLAPPAVFISGIPSHFTT